MAGELLGAGGCGGLGQLLETGRSLGQILGQLLETGRSLGQMDLVISVMIMIAVIGTIIDQIVFTRLERSVQTKWGVAKPNGVSLEFGKKYFLVHVMFHPKKRDLSMENGF